MPTNRVRRRRVFAAASVTVLVLALVLAIVPLAQNEPKVVGPSRDTPTSAPVTESPGVTVPPINAPQTDTTPRIQNRPGFAELADDAVRQFAKAIERREIESIQGRIGFAADLRRRIAEAPVGTISVRIMGFVSDSAKAQAHFLLRIDDNSKRPLLDFTDLVATFVRSADGLRLQTVDSARSP